MRPLNRLVAAMGLLIGVGSLLFSGSPVSAQDAGSGIQLLAISDTICFALTAADPDNLLQVGKCTTSGLYQPANLQAIADVHGDGDGIVEPEDFAAIDLDGNQLHQLDYNPLKDTGSLWIIAFVNDDDPVRFDTTSGTLVPSLSSTPFGVIPGIDQAGKTWICDTQSEDEDCDDDGVKGDGVIVTRLVGKWGSDIADLGPGVVSVNQNGKYSYLDFTVVGEPHSIEFVTLEDTIQDGAGGADQCPLPGDSAGFLSANATPERSIVLARVLDDAGTSITGGFVLWETDDEAVAKVATGLTPSIDLGAFGFGAPNIICGTKMPGTATVLAQLTRTETLEGGALLDPQADIGREFTIDFTVVGVPAAMTLVSEPATIDCNGVNTATVTATVTDAGGNPVAAGQEVTFRTQVLATASPITATTNGDGAATSEITPLAVADTGIPVVVTAGDVQQSILVSCGAPSPPSGEVPPPSGGGTTPPPSGGGQGVITAPNTGFGPQDTSMSLAPVIALALIGLSLLFGGVAIRRVH